jgi:hypothetical protein
MKKITAAESLCKFLLKSLEKKKIKDIDNIDVIASVVRTLHDHVNILLIMVIEKTVREESGENGFRLTEENLTTAYKEAIKIRKKEILNKVEAVI